MGRDDEDHEDDFVDTVPAGGGEDKTDPFAGIDVEMW